MNDVLAPAASPVARVHVAVSLLLVVVEDDAGHSAPLAPPVSAADKLDMPAGRMSFHRGRGRRRRATVLLVTVKVGARRAAVNDAPPSSFDHRQINVGTQNAN